MQVDEESVVMIVNAIGRAVVELRVSGIPVTEITIAQKLEELRREETNVIGKGVYRDAAEMVRSGRLL